MLALMDVLGGPVLCFLGVSAFVAVVVIVGERVYQDRPTPATYCPACLCQQREHEVDDWHTGRPQLCRTHDHRLRRLMQGDQREMVRAGMTRYACQSGR